jgi:hypothetical protein
MVVPKQKCSTQMAVLKVSVALKWQFKSKCSTQMAVLKVSVTLK